MSDTSKMTDVPAAEWATQIAGDYLNNFLEKNKDYESTPPDALGSKGMFPDIWRKVGKLRRAIWEDKPLRFESKEEVLSDLFGHILLISHQIERERAGQKMAGMNAVYDKGDPRADV